MSKLMVVFDFDRTIIDGDSDRWLITHMGLTHLFDQLVSAMPWNSLMNRMMEELHFQGKTIEDVGECLKQMPLHPKIISALKFAHSMGCDLRIVSDANQFFIKTILEQHHVAGLFTDIITNPSYVDDEGRLRIVPYHDIKLAPHGCSLCPSNMCK
ncbi:Thiamine phosphate phosphatase-like protein, partial [Bienertia sinuspersici]